MEKFDLKTKLRQTTVLNRIASLAAGNIPEPVAIDFDCTTRCNLSCFFCTSKNILGELEFSKEELIRWADVFHDMNVKAVILTGGGEPLMNRNIDDFIARLRDTEQHPGIGLVTNGVLLYRYTGLENLDWVRISLDAGNRDTFLRLKGVDCYSQVINNMEQYNRVKQGESGISFLVINSAECSNIGEIYTAAKRARNIGCDYFEIKLQFDDAHVDIPLRTDEIECIREQVLRSLELAGKSFRVYINHNMTNLLKKGTSDFSEPVSCPVCSLRTIITPHGLYACSYYRGNSLYKYGESMPSEFRKIWYSEDRIKFVDQICPYRDCHFRCARKDSNIEIWKIAEMIKAGDSDLVSVEDVDLFI